MSETVFIGTSDAFGSRGRRQSAYLIRAQSGSVLIDCGTTTCTGLESLDISRDEIDAIAISHFHSDHFGGIPTLLLGAAYEDRRKKPLIIAGPEGVRDRILRASAALGHPMNGQQWNFPIKFLEVRPGETSEVGPVALRAFETHHSRESKPHGFVVSADNKSISYSGDTGWFDELPGHMNGADLSICECTHVEKNYPMHLSLEELTEHRSLFDCGRLILTHAGRQMRDCEDYNGFEIADDGLVIKI